MFLDIISYITVACAIIFVGMPVLGMLLLPTHPHMGYIDSIKSGAFILVLFSTIPIIGIGIILAFQRVFGI